MCVQSWKDRIRICTNAHVKNEFGRKQIRASICGKFWSWVPLTCFSNQNPEDTQTHTAQGTRVSYSPIDWTNFGNMLSIYVMYVVYADNVNADTFCHKLTLSGVCKWPGSYRLFCCVSVFSCIRFGLTGWITASQLTTLCICYLQPIEAHRCHHQHIHCTLPYVYSYIFCLHIPLNRTTYGVRVCAIKQYCIKIINIV